MVLEIAKTTVVVKNNCCKKEEGENYLICRGDNKLPIFLI